MLRQQRKLKQPAAFVVILALCLVPLLAHDFTTARNASKQVSISEPAELPRRNPNEAPDVNFDGYNFWLVKLNQFNGNFVSAEMVKAFILSGEYKQRFGP